MVMAQLFLYLVSIVASLVIVTKLKHNKEITWLKFAVYFSVCLIIILCINHIIFEFNAIHKYVWFLDKNNPVEYVLVGLAEVIVVLYIVQFYNNKKENDLPKLTNYTLLALYGIVNFIIMVKHEPWRDEINAWLIARDLNLVGIFQHMRIEGHSCLWHLILVPFAKAGISVNNIGMISFAIMMVAAYIFITRSPFHIYVKTVILFSVVFTYFMPVIARDYCLVILSVTLLAATYKKRFEKPIYYGFLIFILFQSHVIMAGMGVMLIITYFAEIVLKKKYRNWKVWLSPLIGLLGLIIFVWQVYTPDSSSVYTTDLGGIIVKIVENIPSAVLNMFNQFHQVIIISTSIDFSLQFLFLVILFFIVCCCYLWKYYLIELAILLGAIGSQTIIYAYVWGISSQRAICSLVVLVFFIWIVYDKKYLEFSHEKARKISALFKPIALLLVMVFCICSFGLVKSQIIADYSSPYSNGAKVGEYINSNLPKHSVIVSTKDFMGTSVAGYLKTSKIWSPKSKSFYTFTDWSDKSPDVDFGTLIQRINNSFSVTDDVYILYSPNFPMRGEKFNELTEVFRSEGAMSDENYIIYKYEYKNIHCSIDSCNGNSVLLTDHILIDNKNSLVKFVGWAGDQENKRPIDGIYVIVDGKIVNGSYGLERTDVVTNLNSENLRYSGFEISVPIEDFTSIKEVEIKFVAKYHDQYKVFSRMVKII
jgi:hypothetical protein